MILYTIGHIEKIVKMKRACIDRANDYNEDYVIKYIAKQMGIKRYDAK